MKDWITLKLKDKLSILLQGKIKIVRDAKVFVFFIPIKRLTLVYFLSPFLATQREVGVAVFP